MARDSELERVCAELYPRLYGALAHHVGDRGLAEELAQETLVRLCDHWPKVRGASSIIGWAYRVGVNLANTHFRRMRAERRARARLEVGTAKVPAADAADSVALSAALAHLTERQRQAVVCRYYLGLTALETGEVLGVSAEAVRGLTHRAVRDLRQLFQTAIEQG